MDKDSTGISGFDAITRGGIPRGRATLINGGTGSGKTVFALQTLVHGATRLEQPGIFVAFEEHPERILANASDFGWNLSDLQPDRLYFLDAQPDPGLIQSGQFDLGGLLANLDARCKKMGARRIVFDAMDIVLALMRDSVTIRVEVHRLHEWLRARDLTALITSKRAEDDGFAEILPSLEFMQFMVDCSVRLSHAVVDGVSQRSLRVCKYRGSAFEENETPMVITSAGLDVAYVHGPRDSGHSASSERISSGVDQLDEMLGGGHFRGAGILLTGAPGTAKTTLCGAFAEATCRRGEPTVFVSFDSRSDEIVRNLASVSIDLAPHIESGLLRLVSLRALSGSAEIHLNQIRELAREHQAGCLIIDPLSALSKAGGFSTASGVAERLMDWAKVQDLTVMCTSLLNETREPTEATPIQISTIADTWIHLTYVIQAGERNRGLSIIKSRGTGHSNQVRELILDNDGISLTEVYTAGGEVLMGSMRWTREREDQLAARERTAAHQRDYKQLETEASELESRIAMLNSQLQSNLNEAKQLKGRLSELEGDERQTRSRLQQRRSGAPDSADEQPSDE